MSTNPDVPSSKRVASDDDSGEDDSTECTNAPPMTRCVRLKQHRKIVSGMDIDRSGSRMTTISHDYSMALWDFAGMDCTLNPFRFVTPINGCPLRAVRFSTTGELLAVVGGGTVKLVDRHGARVLEYPKGDPYLKDMKRTLGHVGNVLGLDWNPREKDLLASAGHDGTVRFWSSEFKKMQDILVVKPLRGGKPPAISQIKFVPKSKLLAITGSDGMIRFYDTKGPWLRPSLEISDAHSANVTISGLGFDSAGCSFATRALDDSLKLWDIRNTKVAVGAVTALENAHEETSVIFSPDSRLVVTGTSARRGGHAKGTVAFFDSLSLASVCDPVVVADSSVVSLCWPTSLDQIFIGDAEGTISVYYDPDSSKKGITLPLSKTASSSASHAVMGMSEGAIISPHALPLFRSPRSRNAKKAKTKARQDPVTSHLPERPIEGPGIGGRLGSSVTQSIMKNVIRDTRRDEDPREALLKYAEVAERDPKFVSPAYQTTQPKPILDAELLRKEAEAEAKKKRDEATTDALRKALERRKQY